MEKNSVTVTKNSVTNALFDARFIELYNYDIWKFLTDFFEKNPYDNFHITNNIGVYNVSPNKFNKALRFWLQHRGFDYMETTKHGIPVKKIIFAIPIHCRGTYEQTVYANLQDFLNSISATTLKKYGRVQKKLLLQAYKQFNKLNKVEEIYTVNDYEALQAIINKIERAGGFIIQHAQEIQWKY